MFNFKKIIGFVLGMIIFVSQAQDIIVSNDQQTSPAYGNSGIGQSFISPIEGEMTAISVRPLLTKTATLLIFASADASGSPIYSQSNVSLIGTFSPTTPQQIIALDSPVSITAGQAYSFVLIGAGGLILYHNTSDTFADGSLISYDGISYSVSTSTDLDFAIYGRQIAAPNIAEPQAIPTTSFGVLMGLLVVLFAMSSALLKRNH